MQLAPITSPSHVAVVAAQPETMVKDAWSRRTEQIDPRTGGWKLPTPAGPFITVTARDAAGAALATSAANDWGLVMKNLAFTALDDAVKAASDYSVEHGDRPIAVARHWGGRFTLWTIDGALKLDTLPTGASRLDVTFHDEDVFALAQGTATAQRD